MKSPNKTEWALGKLFMDPQKLFVLWAVKVRFCVSLDDFRNHYGPGFPITKLVGDLREDGFLRQGTSELVLTETGEQAVVQLGDNEFSRYAVSQYDQQVHQDKITPTSIYRIHMDREWGLNDLYEFPHAFAQTYAFAYCFDSDLSPSDENRINYALESYPWKGGYSYVNIYKVLQDQVPEKLRPLIKQIQYASPGWMDLALNLDPAIKVAASVASIAASIVATTKAYAAVQKTLQQIKLQREKAKVEHLKLSKAQATALRGLCDELSKLIGFKKFDDLLSRTGDIEIAAKLIAAQFRRLKVIAGYQSKGKIMLPTLPRDKISIEGNE